MSIASFVNCALHKVSLGVLITEFYGFCRVSSIESRSSHPMASVLVDYAQSKSVEPKSDTVTEFQIYPGEGIYGEIDGEGVYIGNKRILSRSSCETGW